MTGNDPLRAYNDWRRTEERKARAWAVMGWLAILVTGTVAAALGWIIVTLALILFG